MSTQINDAQQAAGLVSRVFPTGTQAVFAVLTVEGVDEATVISGHWFQLSVPDAPPEGAEVSSAGVTLTGENIYQGGASGPCVSQCARVALKLAAGSGALADGDWVLRIYADETFLRTMGFVIGDQGISANPLPTTVLSGSPSAASTPSGSPSAASTPPGTTVPGVSPTVAAPTSPVPTPTRAQQTYTVVAGDSLSSIAARFKPANETVESYVARLAALNNVSPNAFLSVGQVLKLPGPQ